ncbi:hypothetical protein TELCIR_05846 [Teladorsagia circumcincta]|uniref:glucuronosyltransferase n=1 Tax=Teladorsagia circumcincta TaxID=45464 RepID=A0A2G9UPR0_TELCI|nr:hypothetical protein TELCIR_05846 [Teladorsagia circumcincta]
MKRLADEKFDVGITETVIMCGLGIFEHLKIPASISTFSAVHSAGLSKGIGEPVTPSYVPGKFQFLVTILKVRGMSTKGDRMNIVERFKNVISVVVGDMFFSKTFAGEIELFREKFGPHFKGYNELLADSSYAFTNSNPYLDYPRPMLHKTVPIGGIAVDIDPKKNTLSKGYCWAKRRKSIGIAIIRVGRR